MLLARSTVGEARGGRAQRRGPGGGGGAPEPSYLPGFVLAGGEGAAGWPGREARPKLVPCGSVGRLGPQAIHRYSVRKLLTTAFAGLVENEINDFHPIMQLMQLAHEPSDNVNYVPFIQPGDLLFTAGWRDGCVPREGAGALGLALVRYGLVELNLKHGKFHSFVDPTSFMEAGPGLPFFDFPLYQANLDNGKYGLFIELATGHDANGAEYTQSDFLANTLGLPGADGEIQAPEVTSFGGTCDERYDNVY